MAIELCLLERQATLEIMERLLMAVVRERILPSRWLSEATLAIAGPRGELAVPVARRYRMGRFDLGGWPRRGGPQGAEVTELAALCAQLLPEDSAATEELLASREQALPALQAQAEKGLGEVGHGSLADWEGRVWLGHPLHPGARLRRGVSAEDSRRFGPEWQVRLGLPLLDLPASEVTTEGCFETLFQQWFPQRRAATGRILLPVHPWAAERDLPQRFAEAFASGRWRWSDLAPLAARPSMSFRTVLLDTASGDDGHLKLPVAVQTTGATRTVSEAAAVNGPRLSRFLAQLWSAQPERLAGLQLMAEPASARLAGVAGDQARFLATLLRQGPGPAHDGQRWLVPAAALLESRQNPLFARAAAYYGVPVSALWERYCARLLPPLAFLGDALGVALEAHPQNMVVEFLGPRGRMPEIVFHYRDLGGIRVLPQRLREGLARWAPGVAMPEFWPGSATCTESPRDLSSKFIYSVLQNHLGELSRALLRSDPGAREDDFWRVVGQRLAALQPTLDGPLGERLWASSWDLKAMWRMRLRAQVTEYSYAPVDNPLRREP